MDLRNVARIAIRVGNLATLSRDIVAAGALLLCAFAADAAAPRATLTVDTLLKAPTIAAYSPPSFSPDMRYVAYVVTDNSRRAAVDDDVLRRMGVAWYAVGSDIWVTDLHSGERRNITAGRGNNWAAAWSPDSTRLAFLSASAGPPMGPARLWVWERSTGKARQASQADVREGFAGLQWASARSVLVSLFPDDLGRDGFAALMEGKKAQGDPKQPTVHIFEFAPSAATPIPNTDQINLDIFRRDAGLVDVETGTLGRLTTRSRVSHYLLSPDSRKLAYTVLTRPANVGTGQYLFNVFVKDIASGDSRVIASDIQLTLLGDSFSWSPSGDAIAYRTGGPTAGDEIYVVPVAGGKAVRVAQRIASDELAHVFAVEPPAWDSSGTHVFYIVDKNLWRAATDGSGAAKFASLPDRELQIIAPRQQRLWSADGGRSALLMTTNPSTKAVGFARVDLPTGTTTQIVEENKRYGGYGTEPTIAPDSSSVAYVAEDSGHAADIYLAGNEMREPRRLSRAAPSLDGLPFGRADVLEWHSIDGDTQHGALIYPAGYEAGRTYPLIVKVYGGSKISDDLNRFGFAIAPIENLQIFANRGYAILLADSKLNVGTPMVDLMKSVMPGINKAVEMGVADPKRIGVMGHSYGGYSTLSLIVQSPRFKAAVMRAGMGDLISGYGQLSPDGTNYGLAWSEGGQGRMGGSPWQYRTRYLENSPVFYLDRVETPLLIIHGTKDDAVPVFLADEIFTGLRRLGKTVTYARYEGEGHWEGSWSYINQLDVLERILGWFDKQLKE